MGAYMCNVSATAGKDIYLLPAPHVTPSIFTEKRRNNGDSSLNMSRCCMTVGNSMIAEYPLHVCKCCIAQALGAQNCGTVSMSPIKKEDIELGCLSTCHVPLQPRQRIV
ncbi:unnamed protein product [Prunus armeniaca]|uniref:Uncharacterized protein n=1 Tax=Prunus armeniaca TaxID=36596 RepID=A0A6J5V1S8_PRUAR|nr:unnamed protein product [Prunus armeniaca]